MKPFPLVVLALALAGCAADYAYVPVTNATVERGRVGADYPIPADMPHGDLRVTSYGIASVAPRGEPKNQTSALHLRFSITNNADANWTFDTRDARVELSGYGSSVAAFASANAGTAPPVVRVPPLEKRVVDLFFPLPGALQHASQLPAFDVVWRLEANGRFVARRTQFQRVELVPPVDYDGYGTDYWWGPPYWYNPAYGSATFVGGVEVPPNYFSRPIVIRGERSPHVMGRESPAEPGSPHPNH